MGAHPQHALYLIHADHIEPVVNAAAAGDRDAWYTMKAVKQSIEELEKSGEQKNCMALDCDTKFNANNWPPAFAVWIPLDKGEGEKFTVIAHPICASCANRPDLMDAIWKSTREAWPDSKPRRVEPARWT